MFFNSQYKRLVAAVSLTLMVLQPMVAAAQVAQYSYFKSIPGLVVSGSPVPTESTPAQVGLSSASLSFVGVPVHGQATQTVVLTNKGSTDLTVSDVVVEDTSLFSVSQSCNVLAAGESCIISVTIYPASLGSQSSRLAIVTSASATPNFVALASTGAQSDLVADDGIVFDDQMIGQTQIGTLHIHNNGTAAASLPAYDNNTVREVDFHFVSTTCSTTLAAAASCDVVASTTPTSLGALRGTVDLGFATASLAVNGVQGLASFNPPYLNFAEQSVGVTSATQYVTVTNQGTAPLTLSGISVDQGVADFNQNNNCAAPLGIEMSCLIAVAMTPSVTGPLAGRLLVSNNGSSGTGVIALAGQGTFANYQVRNSVSHAELTDIVFAPTALNQVSAPVTIEIANVGTEPLAFTGSPITLAAPFELVSTTCSSATALPLNATCQAVITFHPVTAAAYSAQYLTVHTATALPAVSVPTLSAKLLPVLGTFSIPGHNTGDAAFNLTPPASDSNGAMSYTSDTPSVALVSGNAVTVGVVGQAVITATQAATAIYASQSTTATLYVTEKVLTYATWNPMDKSAACTLTNGNLTALCNTWTGVRATEGKSSGKWYWEVKLLTQNSGSGMMLGIATASASSVRFDTSASSAFLYPDADLMLGTLPGGSLISPTTGGAAIGTTYMLALDMDNNALYIGKNGTWLRSGSPTSGTLRTGAVATFVNDKFYPAVEGAVPLTLGTSTLTYGMPAGYSKLTN